MSIDGAVKAVGILSRVLADTYTVYLKTQNYHWNVEGERFFMLHGLFEKQYEELADAVDAIAEQIRTLGHRAPASFTEFLEISEISEELPPNTDTDMISVLFKDHEFIIKYLRNVLKEPGNVGEAGTEDFLMGRLFATRKDGVDVGKPSPF